MEIKDFVKDGKLMIPIEEIDNIYTWIRVSKTQELLLSSKVYFKLMEKSFNEDVNKLIPIMKDYLKYINDNAYTLSDFITFKVNHDKIFNGKMCFVYSNSLEPILSLICYIAHDFSVYHVKEDTLTDMIFDKIDNKEHFIELLDTDMLFLNANTSLPEHKYKEYVLNSLFTKRCSENHYTFVWSFDKSQLFGNFATIEKIADLRGVKCISPMKSLLMERRKADYKELMQLWYSMVANIKNMVYSHGQPKVSQRTIGSNNG